MTLSVVVLTHVLARVMLYWDGACTYLAVVHRWSDTCVTQIPKQHCQWSHGLDHECYPWG